MSKSIMVNYLSKFSYILVIIFPVSIVAGPAISDGIIILCSLIFIYISYKEKLWSKYFLNYFAIFFWCWCTLLILNSVLSFNPLLSLESSLFYFRFGIFTLVVCYLIDSFDNFKKYFFWVLLSLIIFVIFDSYLQYFTSYDVFGYHFDKTAGLIRMAGPFGDEWVLGIFLSKIIATLMALASLIIFSKKNKFFLLISIGALSGGVIFLSGERTAFATYIIFIFLTLIFVKNMRLTGIVILLISAVSIAILVTNDREIKYRMTQQVVEQIISENGKINFYSQAHENFLVSSYRMFSENKFFGVGPKLYREACSFEKYSYNDSCSTHPHNFYLQLLAETGITGTAPLIAIFVTTVFFLFKSLIPIQINQKIRADSNAEYKIFLLLAIIINLWPFFPTLSFFNNWSSALTFLPFGFIMHEFYFKNKK